MSNPEDRYTDEDVKEAEQREKHHEDYYSAGMCPNCNSMNTDVLWFEKEPNGTLRAYICLDCDNQWTQLSVGGAPP